MQGWDDLSRYERLAKLRKFRGKNFGKISKELGRLADLSYGQAGRYGQKHIQLVIKKEQDDQTLLRNEDKGESTGFHLFNTEASST